VDLKQFITKYNWLISIILATVVGPAVSYLQTSDLISWQGLVAAVLTGITNYFTTEKGRDQGQLEGAAVARSQTLPAAPAEAKPGDPYNF
jgi:hypothetical protein